jgi:hypothetical protein
MAFLHSSAFSMSRLKQLTIASSRAYHIRITFWSKLRARRTFPVCMRSNRSFIKLTVLFMCGIIIKLHLRICLCLPRHAVNKPTSDSVNTFPKVEYFRYEPEHWNQRRNGLDCNHPLLHLPIKSHIHSWT